MKILRRQMARPALTLAVLGHHKCASTYIHHVLRTTSRVIGLRMKDVYIGDILPYGYHLREPFCVDQMKNIVAITHDSYDILYHGSASNAVVNALERRGKYRGLHLIRDPRDMIVSGYFSHLYSHPLNSPWFAEQRRHLQKLDNIEQGLLAEIDFDACYIETIGAWDYANPSMYEMRFERLIENPLDEITAAYEFLGLFNQSGMDTRLTD